MTYRLVQQGPRDAKVVIVGEAPGDREDRTGLPFQGPSGDLLNGMLARAGIDREACFITNVCHIRPPGNDFEKVTKGDLLIHFKKGVHQLKKDIEAIKPNLVIALGAWPLYVLTGKDGIEKWRGSILESSLVKGTKVIGTYHPAAVFRFWDYKAIIEFDLQRCRTESGSADIRYRERRMVLNPSSPDKENLVTEILTTARELSVDIECVDTPQGWKLSCVGFADSDVRALVLPCGSDENRILIRRLLMSPIPKIFQNGAFDYTVLTDNGFEVNGFHWDTMLAHHCLYPEAASSDDEISKLTRKKTRQAALQKGLAFLNSIYTDVPFYKDDGKLWRETQDWEMFWRYNALDCLVTKEIRDKQEAELIEFGTMGVFKETMELLPILIKMMKRGVLIDDEHRKRVRAQVEQEIINLQTALNIKAGEDVNVKSGPQIQKLLYEKFKLPVKINRKTKRPTTDKDALIELDRKHSHPVLKMILAIRQRRDYIERYLDAKVDLDGRMRCSFDPTGTRSGRLSSRASIYGSGTNLQNIPSRRPEGEAIRQMFVPDKDKIFVYRDFSQAEARVVAYLSRSNGLIELFEDAGRDVHTENASRIFGVHVSAVTPEQRYLAKKVVHACNYGMGEDRLVQVVNEDFPYTGISINKAKAASLIEAYFMIYPEIRNVFWKEVEQELKHTRTLNTPFGRKRTFFGRWDDKLFREAYSYIPQSTVGDLGRRAIVECHNQVELVVPGAEVLLNVHDSILMQCNTADVFTVASKMEAAMNIPITVHGKTFTIPTDCKVGFNWANRPKKDIDKNPNGLRDIEVYRKEQNVAA